MVDGGEEGEALAASPIAELELSQAQEPSLPESGEAEGSEVLSAQP